MRKNIIFTAIAMLAFAFTVSAQKGAPDFNGKWTLEVAKSKLGDRNTIESETMTVTQTAADFKAQRDIKRTPPPAGGGGGGGGFGGGMGGGGGAPAPMTYTFGKETKIDAPGPGGATIPVILNAKWDGAKLHLSSSRTFSGPQGEITTTTKEIWELGADGKTLTVSRESTSPRGTTATTSVYSKN